MPTDVRQTDPFRRELFACAPVGLCRASPDGTILDANEEFARILGCPGGHELPAVRLAEVFARSCDRLRWDEALARHGVVRGLEAEILSRQRARRWVRASARAVRDASGAVAFVEAALEDVTDRLAEEEATQQRAERSAAILDAALDAVVTIDAQGTIVYFNAAAERMFGCRREEAVGREVAEVFVPPAFREAHRAGLRRLVATGEAQILGQRLELSAVRADGTQFPVELTIPRIEAGGEPLFTGFIHDITERRRAEEALRHSEEQLRHAQKMDAVGRLAGGIAHDFNNLLTVILGNVELAQRVLHDEDPLRARVDEIERAAERAAALTRKLLVFSRKQVPVTQVLDVNVLLRDMGQMLRRLLGEHLTLVTAGAERACVRADPSQIEQVVVNLAVNARDAMPDGGRLTLETVNVTLDAEQAKRSGVGPGEHVMLAVKDTGVGMDAATLSRIFEPFFTTKEPGRGTGLGLSIVYGIVKQSGGAIDVASEPGRGTTFRVYLPRVAGEPQRSGPAQGPTVQQGSETVLVVEDEQAVRELVRTILKDAGYTVLCAANGEVAEELLVAGVGVDLVLTDVVMPQMGGTVLARRLGDCGITCPVLYMSGYTDAAAVEDDALPPGTPCLRKPFTADALRTKVRATLDAARA